MWQNMTEHSLPQHGGVITLTERQSRVVYSRSGRAGLPRLTERERFAMTSNEVIQLTAVLNGWKDTRGKGLKESQQFLRFAVEQILKTFPCADEDIEYGLIDKGGD